MTRTVTQDRARAVTPAEALESLASVSRDWSRILGDAERAVTTGQKMPEEVPGMLDRIKLCLNEISAAVGDSNSRRWKAVGSAAYELGLSIRSLTDLIEANGEPA